MMSRLASKILVHCLASPYSRCAIFERLSPFTTTYLRPLAGGDVELPERTSEKSALGSFFLPNIPLKIPMIPPCCRIPCEQCVGATNGPRALPVRATSQGNV